MQRLAIPFFVILTLTAGCQGNQMTTRGFSPFGNATVAPPATNSYGKPGTYYQGPNLPPGAPSLPIGKKPQSISLGSADANPTSNRSSTIAGQWTAVGTHAATQLAESRTGNSAGDVDRGVVQASFQNESPIRIQDSSSADSTSGVVIRGMPANDYSTVAESDAMRSKSGFVEITQLPPPPSGVIRSALNRSSISDAPVGTGVVNSSSWKPK